MASSNAFSSNTINNGSQEYPYPSHVNPASFLSIKLSGENDYDAWQEQMMCLVDSHDMLGFIDGTFKSPKEKYREWKRSDMLVKGWIFGSVSKDVMKTLVGLHSAHDVWNKLNTTYSTPDSPPTSPTRNKDMVKYVPLHRALLRGDWEKAQKIFNNDKDALTAKLMEYDECALVIVISRCRNFHLVENLLKDINPESLPTLVDRFEGNAVHRAAIVGNTIGAEMVVERNPHLLFMLDDDRVLPIHKAIINFHKDTFEYLLDVSKKYIDLSQEDGYRSPFEGKLGVLLINEVIDAGLFEHFEFTGVFVGEHDWSAGGGGCGCWWWWLWVLMEVVGGVSGGGEKGKGKVSFLYTLSTDVASKLIQEFPEMTRKSDRFGDNALTHITNKPDAYFSGTRYNFYQRFVYSRLFLPLLITSIII
ncbi:hypothetical protein OSB04_012945 [Centaurea solstitialis]|uniref:Uncharacterized protein n=1 Tax=Centaurea solstitialis TaxID=347529 RepID=A0AA38TQ84_9ASTR|nr:hypothetical protein OSB04_012945 [Centaurea solstitialis]